MKRTLGIVVLIACCTMPAVAQTPLVNPAAAGAAATTAATQVNAAATVVTAGAAVPGVAPPPNLWTFLGVPQMFRGAAQVARRVRYRVNSILPVGKKQPPMDAPPPGMASPAANGAANMQKVEANAEANVQSLKYLGNFGCSDCFPEIEEALYHALSDCMPGPRLAALEVINKHGGSSCTHCAGNTCCSLRIREALYDLAHGVDELGCPKVTDPHQLRLAREALRKCCCVPLRMPAPPTVNPEGVLETLPIPPSDDPLETSRIAEPNPTSMSLASFAQPVTDDAAAGGAAALGPPKAEMLDLLVAEVGTQPIRLHHLLTTTERATSLPPAHLLKERLESVIHFHALTAQAVRTGFEAPPDENQHVPQPGELPYARAYLDYLARFDQHVTRQQAYEYYQTHKQEFLQPESLVWEQLTVPIRYFSSPQHAFRVAEHLRRQAIGAADVEAPPAFEPYEYIVEVSDPIPVAQVPPQIHAVLQKLGEGEVSEVHRVGDAYQVYSVQRRFPERTGTFQEMEHAAYERVLQQRRNAAQNAALQQTRMNVAIWVAPNIDSFMALSPPAADRTRLDSSDVMSESHTP